MMQSGVSGTASERNRWLKNAKKKTKRQSVEDNLEGGGRVSERNGKAYKKLEESAHMILVAI